MNFDELEYQEDFVKVTDNPEYVIKAVREVHASEYGWVVGTPSIKEVNDPHNGKYQVTIPLKKYHVEKGRTPR